MSFLDRFRPQWKNTDPDARADATRELGPEMSDVLVEIAKTDDDGKVRRIAIKRLEDPALLWDVAAAQDDDKVREAAEERATGLLLAEARGQDEDAANQALQALEEHAPAHLGEVVLHAPLEGVRRNALEALARSGDDEGLALVVREGADLEARTGALAQISDLETVALLARGLDHGEVAQAALRRVEDPQALLSISREAAIKAVREEAERRLDALPDDQHPTRLEDRRRQRETLVKEVEALSGSSDWDPSRHAIDEARQRWDGIGGTPEEDLEERLQKAMGQFDERHKSHLAALAEKAEQMEQADSAVTTEEPPMVAPTVETADTIDVPPAEDTEAAEAAASAPPEAAAEPAPEAPAAPAEAPEPSAPAAPSEPAEPVLSEAQQARLALCRQVEELEGDAIPAGIEEAEAAWSALPAPDEGEAEGKDDLGPRFQRAVARARERHQEWEAGAEYRAQQVAILAEAEELARSEDLESAQEAWQAIRTRWREATPKNVEVEAEIAERFHTVEERFAELRAEERQQMEQRKKDNLARLQGLTRHLETMVEQEELNLRKAERRLREAQIALRHPGPLPAKKEWEALKPRLHAAREALMPRVRELEQLDEWQRWANVPIQEELGARMEALVDAEDLGAAAKEMRRLMEEWKKASRVPQHKAEELWQRFITARDKVREKVDVHFAAQAEERKENLAKKRALCEQAEALQDSSEWNKTADALKALQAEWKKIGPVPRKHSDAVWKRFRAACDHFFSRRKERFDALQTEREENLKKKEALVEKAEALQDSTDWAATTDAYKRLQAEWKSIGPVPRKVSDAIWKRFRGACDHFFDRRGRKDELDLDDNVTEREEIVATLEGLLAPQKGEDGAEAAPDPEALAEQIKEARGRWRAAGPVPVAARKKLSQRYSDASAKLMKAYPDALAGTELDPKAVADRRTKIVEDLEKLLAERQEAEGEGGEASIQDLAAQLKAALASNTIRRGAATSEADPGKREAERKLRNLQARWHDLPGDAEAALQKRYDKAAKALGESLG